MAMYGGYMPQVLDVSSFPSSAKVKGPLMHQDTMLLLTRRLKFHCATAERKRCGAPGTSGTAMPDKKALFGGFEYYLEAFQSEPKKQNTDIPLDTNPVGGPLGTIGPVVQAKISGWTDDVRRIPAGDKTGFDGQRMLFETTGCDELSCPTFSIVSDTDNFWVLGAFDWPRAAEVRQYSRATLAHEKTYVSGLCSTDTKTGITYQKASNGAGITNTPSYRNWRPIPKWKVGGSLAIQYGDSGRVKYLYGLGLCGSLFRIEPAVQQELVLAWWQYTGWDEKDSQFTGIALQTYKVPREHGGYDMQENLFISYIDGSGDPHGCDRTFECSSTRGQALSKIFLFDATAASKVAKDHWITKGNHPKPGDTWTWLRHMHTRLAFRGGGGLNKKSDSPAVLTTIEARRIGYSDGFIYW